MFGKKTFSKFLCFPVAYCTTTLTNNAKKIKTFKKKLLFIVIECLRPIPIDKLPILLGIQSDELRSCELCDA